MDAKGFATKSDLKDFATKDDLKGLATKVDLIQAKDEILEAIGEHGAEILNTRDKKLKKIDIQVRVVSGKIELVHRAFP